MTKEQPDTPPFTKEEEMARGICKRWSNGVPPWDMGALEDYILEALYSLSAAPRLVYVGAGAKPSLSEWHFPTGTAVD